MNNFNRPFRFYSPSTKTKNIKCDITYDLFVSGDCFFRFVIKQNINIKLFSVHFCSLGTCLGSFRY